MYTFPPHHTYICIHAIPIIYTIHKIGDTFYKHLQTMYYIKSSTATSYYNVNNTWLPVSNKTRKRDEARLPRLLLEVSGHPHSLLRAQPVGATVRCHALKIHEVNEKTHEN